MVLLATSAVLLAINAAALHWCLHLPVKDKAESSTLAVKGCTHSVACMGCVHKAPAGVSLRWPVLKLLLLLLGLVLV
jgi:hypothetical protein